MTGLTLHGVAYSINFSKQGAIGRRAESVPFLLRFGGSSFARASAGPAPTITSSARRPMRDAHAAMWTRSPWRYGAAPRTGLPLSRPE